MTKRKKSSMRTSGKPKVARSTNDSGQPSQLNNSWSSDDTTIEDGSKSGNNHTTSCKVCSEEIIMNNDSINDISHLKCNCNFCYHGECLTVDDSLLPHLKLVGDIGGWCWPPCIRRAQDLCIKPLNQLGAHTSSKHPLHSSSSQRIGSYSVDTMPEFCQKMSSEINDLKIQIQTIAEFLSPNLTTA